MNVIVFYMFYSTLLKGIVIGTKGGEMKQSSNIVASSFEQIFQLVFWQLSGDDVIDLGCRWYLPLIDVYTDISFQMACIR